MSKRTRPRNLQALERRRRRHARRARIGVVMARARAAVEQMFEPYVGPERLAAAIRRRLLIPGPLFAELAPEYGYEIAKMQFPTPWQRHDIDGAVVETRFEARDRLVSRVTPRPIAPYINMSIGFVNPGEVLHHARAVGDAGTCQVCSQCDGFPVRAGDVPWKGCTSENGCRCVAEPNATGS